MTIHLQYRMTRFGSWVDVDLEATGTAIKTLLLSYQSPSRLDWTMTAPEQSAPIPRKAWVQFWDTLGTDDLGNPLSSSNPLFVGIVEQVSPGAFANQVAYVAFDPTYEAGKTVTVMSLPYQTGAANLPAANSVPRLVYNVKNTGDEDYGYEVAQDSTTAQIISGLLDYCLTPLYYLDAGQSGGAYYAPDLTPMDFIPQQKMVWESTTIRQAVEQVWRSEPRFRMFFHAGLRLWRFYQLNNPGVTPYVNIELNDSGLSNPYPCIGCQVNPAFEDCVTAVSIFGPPTLGSNSFYWDDTVTTPGSGNLVPLGTPQFIENYSDTGGAHTAECYTSFQIYDVADRPGSRTLRDWTQLPVGDYSQSTRFPVFLLSWDMGTTWQAASGAWFDYRNGIVSFPGGIIPFTTATDMRGQSVVAGSTQTKFPPNAFQLLWAPYDVPLSVRYPATGFSGTAYTDYGIETEQRLYDESLAIGREFGVPVTSTTRRAQYVKLAEYLQSTRRDAMFTGNVVLAGCDYQYCRLNKQANISDAMGSTTGWEAMYAPITDVQYDYGEQPTTTMTFNGNWMDLYEMDPGALRERLRIESLTQYSYSQMYGLPMTTFTYRQYEAYNGNVVTELQSVKTYDPSVYADSRGNVTRSEGH